MGVPTICGRNLSCEDVVAGKDLLRLASQNCEIDFLHQFETSRAVLPLQTTREAGSFSLSKSHGSKGICNGVEQGFCP
jgi:hypothetical protein